VKKGEGCCVSSTYCLTGGTFSRPQFSLSQLRCRGVFFEGDCGEKTSGQPQVNLRSRARHWSGCTPRPKEFEHRALDLRLT